MKTQFEKDFFYYEEHLKALGHFPLSFEVELQHLFKERKGEKKATRAIIQRCYRGIVRDKFTGSIVEYLCYISTQHLVNQWVKNDKADEVSFIDTCLKNWVHTKNMVRLFNRDPHYLMKHLNAPLQQRFLIYDFFKIVGLFSCMNYLMESSHSGGGKLSEMWEKMKPRIMSSFEPKLRSRIKKLKDSSGRLYWY